jgi:hypothetical protein
MQGSAGETVKPAKSGLAEICDNSAGILLHRPVIPLPLPNIAGKTMPCGWRPIGAVKFRLTSGLPIPAERVEKPRRIGRCRPSH